MGKPTTLLFVYGTLKRGQRNHALLRDQRYLGTVETAPRYRVYDLGSYPGLIRNEANGVAVRGELWEVSACALAELDEFEEVPDLFVRARVVFSHGETAEAYLWNGPIPPDAKAGSEWPLPEAESATPAS